MTDKVSVASEVKKHEEVKKVTDTKKHDDMKKVTAAAAATAGGDAKKTDAKKQDDVKKVDAKKHEDVKEKNPMTAAAKASVVPSPTPSPTPAPAPAPAALAVLDMTKPMPFPLQGVIVVTGPSATDRGNVIKTLITEIAGTFTNVPAASTSDSKAFAALQQTVYKSPKSTYVMEFASISAIPRWVYNSSPIMFVAQSTLPSATKLTRRLHLDTAAIVSLQVPINALAYICIQGKNTYVCKF